MPVVLDNDGQLLAGLAPGHMHPARARVLCIGDILADPLVRIRELRAHVALEPRSIRTDPFSGEQVEIPLDGSGAGLFVAHVCERRWSEGNLTND